MTISHRRASDRRKGLERRHPPPHVEIDHWRATGWAEQRSQFLTRYLFWAFGLAYYNYGGPYTSWPDLTTIDLVYVAYFLINTALMIHARYRAHSVLRWRLAMWIDIVLLSFSITADPDPMPPMLAFTMVVLGNGLRYGMKIFREAVVGCLVLALVAFLVRYSDHFDGSWATIFLMMFNGIIVLYAYSLMQNIDQVRRQLEAESRVDALTGLLNRRALFERAEMLFDSLERTRQCMAVLFVDLNKFKHVNDRLGHMEGDRVLAEIAGLLKKSVRKSDLAARYGGDEFVVLLPHTDLDKAQLLARRLQDNLHAWAREHRDQLDLSMSIGIAEVPRHGTDLRTVLENVDRAMYVGKSTPENGGIQPVIDGWSTMSDRTLGDSAPAGA
jgi:diguanylate cyclase (GGDEF)-like protein